MQQFKKTVKHREAGTFSAILMALISFLTLTVNVYADVPGRTPPGGAVPNPGTQQQELANITAPAEWNVFEFVVTCGACHAGTVDQHTAPFGNWAGGNMASAQRDPIFRANQIGVNNTVKAVTGQDGAGNVCFRCHSPNGWLSARFDPAFGGKADGSAMIQSILLSTDSEGISCEACHRAVGNVTNKRADLNPLEKVWNLLAGLFDWEHRGNAPVDQVGTSTLAAGNPYGDTSLQFLDGMTYVGKYSGMNDVYFSDLPIPGTPYTGQIYAVYPDSWVLDGNPVNPVPAGQPAQNSAGQTIAYNLDGTLSPLLEVPRGTPISPDGNPIFAAQSFSIEHPTVGGAGRGGKFPFVNDGVARNDLLPTLTKGPGNSVSGNEFIRTSEFCGSCHDLTVPVLNHGMPEQRTFSEWKYSSFSKAANVIADPLNIRTGLGAERCQDCHMPQLKHEYTDLDSGSYNADPWLVGGFPYGKNRTAQGGTSLHKLTGANRDLPQMMKVLYPEVDMEVLGAPTGKDPRVFPGMLSDRSPMWDRAKQNTEITLRDGVDVTITQAPVEVSAGVYEMKVKVLNKSGHRIPTGYPDGRRFWLSVQAKDVSGAPVYVSGVYDAASATLKTTATDAFKRSLGTTIDATVAGGNAVQVYERVTGMCISSDPAKNSPILNVLGAPSVVYPEPSVAVGAPLAVCVPSPNLLNNFILFDNRIPPKGFEAALGREAGIKFWNYDPATNVPVEDTTRYSAAQQAEGSDEVTYRFTAPTGATLTASAEVYWQTLTREFVEHLRTQDTSTVRPQGPPNPLNPNYPNVPNYLSDAINGQPLSSYTALDGSALNDNWGGVAYAAWLATGKGTPFLVDRDDTSVIAAPAATTVTASALVATDPGYLDPVTLAPDVFAAKISWLPVAGADGYTVWVRYGKSELTADWDRLVTVGSDVTSHIEHILGDASVGSPGKTYGFKVEAFNGKGKSVSPAIDHVVATALPAAPTGLTATAGISTLPIINLAWTDHATNEAGFEVWRFGPISVGGVPIVYNGLPPMTIVGGFNAAGGGIGTQTGGPAVAGQATTGANSYADTDATLQVNACYTYQVRAVTNNVDVSTWAVAPSAGCTPAAVLQQINLTAVAASGTRVDLTWTSNATSASFTVKRNGATIGTVAKTVAASYNFADTTAQPGATYIYTVEAAASNPLVVGTFTVTTPAVPVAPTALKSVATTTQITLSWIDNSNNEDGFVIERSSNGGQYQQIPGVGVFTLPGVTSFVDTAVLQNVTYQYRVKAIHLVNGDSGYATGTPVKLVTIPLLAATLLPQPPATVNLVWTASSVSDSFKLVRTAAGTATLNCATAAYNTTLVAATPAFSATDATVAANKYYCYKVAATNPAGTFTSVPVKIFIPAAPAAPTNLTTNGITPTGLTVNWAASVGVNVPTGYEVQKCTNGTATANGVCAAAGAGWATVGTTAARNYSVSALTTGTPYFFRVRAYNPATSGWLNSTVFARPVANPDAPAAVNANTGATQNVSAGNVLTNDLPTGLAGRTVIGLTTVTHTGGPASNSATATVSCTVAGTCTLALTSPGANNTAALRQASKRGTYTFRYTEQYVNNYGTSTSAPATVTVTVN
ncbi:MAG: fibronectin type III domain-containing protein [Desulfuromonadaceae bacterium]